MKKLTVFFFSLSALWLTGCSSLLVSVNDQIPAAETIKLASGAEISILPAELKEEIVKELSGTDYSVDSFKEAVRAELVTELTSRGVKSSAAGSAETNYVKLRVTRLERGIGFFRFFPFFGLGNSYLTIHATLVTSEGKREIIAEKNGQLQGVAQTGDQTKANVSYVATALASAMTK